MKRSVKLDTYIQQIEQCIREEDIANKFPVELYEPIDYFLKIGGKRIRPVLTLMACDAFGGDLKLALKPALTMEFFHNFTLMHDDVMDQADLRRAHATIHSKYNLNTAILSGDTLFAMSYELLEGLPAELYKKVAVRFTHIAKTLCEGQQEDINFENKNRVSLADYLRMIVNKTAILVGLSMEIGALIGGAREAQSKKMYRYGERLGLAYQLQDDWLDLYGDSFKVGKRKGGDIFENKKTILYILAIENANSVEKEELLNWFSTKKDSADKLKSVTDLYASTGAKLLVEEKIQSYFEQALVLLREVELPEKHEQLFRELSHYLMEREG